MADTDVFIVSLEVKTLVPITPPVPVIDVGLSNTALEPLVLLKNMNDCPLTPLAPVAPVAPIPITPVGPVAP